MIAPLRERNAPTDVPSRTEGERRARKWIVRTLLTVHPAETHPRETVHRARLAAAWVMFVAAAYVVYLLVDLVN